LNAKIGSAGNDQKGEGNNKSTKKIEPVKPAKSRKTAKNVLKKQKGKRTNQQSIMFANMWAFSSGAA
jgi:hypothetical protein